MSETTKTPRKHADIAIKFYSDSRMKCWYWSKNSQAWLYVDKPGWEDWEDLDIYEVSEQKPTYKPKKRVTLAGITFNAPETEAPELNTVYWVPHVLSSAVTAFACTWKGSTFDKNALKRGFVHFGKEDAKLHAEAQIKLSEGLMEIENNA